uniref:Uncharacterized protein n=1 Tax=Toxoplasma gondii (strain ATCC 50861 / VEG) TaxID=432359 RepID=A0A0F7V8E3_TOXGV|nr:TPA: hypothetical protein BN1205_031490 [Toxoplasma gondii VEG]
MDRYSCMCLLLLRERSLFATLLFLLSYWIPFFSLRVSPLQFFSDTVCLCCAFRPGPILSAPSVRGVRCRSFFSCSSSISLRPLWNSFHGHAARRYTLLSGSGRVREESFCCWHGL